jgi:hypothetical protein
MVALAMKMIAIVAVAAAAFLTPVSAGLSAGPLVVTVPGVVEQLAADGPRVAVSVTTSQTPGQGCSPVYVWDRASGLIHGFGTCSGCCPVDWISQVALAGDEVAWVHVNVGFSVERDVFKTVPGLAPAGKEAATIARGPGVMPVLSVDTGRIVTGGPGGRLTILRADGSVLRQIDVHDRRVRSAALRGSQLAVLERDHLDVYDASTGERRKSFQLQGSLDRQRKLAGVGGGYVAVVERTSIRVIRMIDGKSTTISFPHTLGPVRAQLVADGLYYSYNDRDAPQTGHVAFLPHAALAAHFRATR